MATINLAEELVSVYKTEDIIYWVETELKAIRQITLSKEADKAFLLGRISSTVADLASVLEALRKKLQPKTKEEPPVVAG